MAIVLQEIIVEPFGGFYFIFTLKVSFVIGFLYVHLALTAQCPATAAAFYAITGSAGDQAIR